MPEVVINYRYPLLKIQNFYLTGYQHCALAQQKGLVIYLNQKENQTLRSFC